MKLVLGDIAEMTTDAIATSAHSDLLPMPGMNAHIFNMANTKELLAACKRIGGCKIGHAVVTTSYGLPCKYIIHVVGAGWYSGHKNEQLLFARCYRRALEKAVAYDCRSVALPLMFSGAYHVPRALALQSVCQVINRFEQRHSELEIILVLHKKSIYKLAQKIYQESKNMETCGDEGSGERFYKNF